MLMLNTVYTSVVISKRILMVMVVLTAINKWNAIHIAFFNWNKLVFNLVTQMNSLSFDMFKVLLQSNRSLVPDGCVSCYGNFDLEALKVVLDGESSSEHQSVYKRTFLEDCLPHLMRFTMW